MRWILIANLPQTLLRFWSYYKCIFRYTKPIDSVTCQFHWYDSFKENAEEGICKMESVIQMKVIKYILIIHWLLPFRTPLLNFKYIHIWY